MIAIRPRFLIIGIFLLVFVYFFLSAFTAYSTFNVGSSESDITPSSYNLEFEEIEIPSSTGANISTWWIPNDSEKTILVLHGVRSQKSDEKVLRYVNEFHHLGFSVAAIDFRNHGISGVGDFTFGIDEINDVYDTLDYLYDVKAVEKIGIWGFSYGATTAVFSGMAYEPSNTNVEVVGVFSDTPYYSLLDLLTTQVARRTPMNLFMADMLKPGILLMTQILYGFDFNSIEENYLSLDYINMPTIVVGCSGDKTVPLYQTTRVHGSLGPNAGFLEFADCNEHGGAYDSDPERYKAEFSKLFKNLFD